MNIQVDVRKGSLILCVLLFHGGWALGKIVTGDKSDLSTPRETGDLLVNGAKMRGLCSEENRSEIQVKQGWCKTILETMLSESSCTSKLLTKLQGKGAGDIEGMGAFCPSFGKASRDKTQLAMVIRNMVASLVKKESEWKPRDGESDSESQGLMSLSTTDATNPAYKCACSKINAKTIFDPHVNLRCGVHIFLTNLISDMSMGGGKGKNKRGTAKYFGPFMDSQKKKRTVMAKETNAYCTARFGAGDGNRGDVPEGNIAASTSSVTIGKEK